MDNSIKWTINVSPLCSSVLSFNPLRADIKIQIPIFCHYMFPKKAVARSC